MYDSSPAEYPQFPQLHVLSDHTATIQDLRAVLVLANRLMSCSDIDFMLRQAVESARNVLGLERCAIFIERNGSMYGTYGTDSRGQTTDEHGLSFPIGEVWYQRLESLKPKDAEWFILQDDTHTEWSNERNIAVGIGWIAVTRIPFVDGKMGFMFNDTTITHTPLNATQQEIVAVFCALLGKIIERKQTEDQIRQALEREKELSDLKSRIIATISHEFRTPMAVIQSATDSLRYYLDRMTAAQREDRIDKIQSQIRRMTTLLDNVLTIGRAETTGLTCDPQPLDVRSICQSIMEEVLQTTSSTHSLTFTHEGFTDRLNLDENLLRHIVLNLLTNAIKYSEPGSPVDLHLVCEAHQVTIRIRDEGIGIPEDDQLSLFQDFHRAKNVGNVAGTGLGLAIVRRSVEAHHGTIRLESTEGIGTTFTVTLPIILKQ